MDLYIDIIFIENFVINFFLLKAVTIILGLKSKNITLFTGAIIGGLYFVTMLLKPNKITFTMISKVILSIIMVWVALKPKTIRSLIKYLIVFFMCSTALAGIMLASSFITGNSILNGKYNIKTIIYSILLMIIIFSLLREFALKKYKDCEYNIKICICEKTIVIPALVDTGNFLIEPVSKKPVIIVETPALKQFVPENVYNIINSGEIDNNTDNPDNTTDIDIWYQRIRFIPYNTLDNKNKIMTGFEPDYVDIWGGDLPEIRKKAVIGMCNNQLHKGNVFKALINPDLME